MGTGAADIRIDEVPVPATIDAPDARGFLDAVHVSTVVRGAAYGPIVLFEPREELWASQDPWRPRRFFLAYRDGVLAGRGELAVLPHDFTTAWIMMEVLPEHRAAGVGSALLARLEREAEVTGRTNIVSEVRIFEEDGPRLDAPTGYGSVPAESAQTRFLLRHGYDLLQTIRHSRIPNPIPGTAELLDETRAFAGPDYALHQWVSTTPERWLADFASLKSRMTTDVPAGDSPAPVDIWTPERVREDDARRLRDGVLTLVITAVEHAPTGELVGYTEFYVPDDPARDAMQWFTVVNPAHRGHRLGILIKTANLAYLEQQFPGRSHINTGNAEENRPMLDINEKLGFTEVGHLSFWKKSLSA